MRLAYLAPLAALTAALAVPAIADHHEEPQLPGVADVSRVTAGTYATDPSHTIVGWTVNHFGFNDYFGMFGDAEGTLTIDPANPTAAEVEISIPITSLAVVSEGLRDHMLRPGQDGAEPDFFGPNPGMAVFRSTSVTMGNTPTEAMITGNLTMNGHTNPVVIAAEFTGAGANPMSKAETIGFEGRATILRSQFGIDTALPVVSDEVVLDISAAFEKQ
ncbi:YceI family protein [Croceicoccus sp. YJ47]|uniref:YceI family protein n=1 Tax=Croceicoccus sp. YJ47 TaxID=2798724 RepID=UPI001922E0B7|nr:YceI family protein [Croceicoccus sp. YJ47]QQN74129.1 YceI family protein [Croceicoccus sp. YJ47]